jgi:hypothetical protein
MTPEPAAVLFGAWDRGDDQIGFITTTRDEHGPTHQHIEAEPTVGRDIETALRERIAEAIDHSRTNETINAEETGADHDHRPAELEPRGDALEIHPLEQTPNLQPSLDLPDQNSSLEPERIGRDPYIQQAIEAERDRQEALEQGIDNGRDADLGLDIER